MESICASTDVGTRGSCLDAWKHLVKDGEPRVPERTLFAEANPVLLVTLCFCSPKASAESKNHTSDKFTARGIGDRRDGSASTGTLTTGMGMGEHGDISTFVAVGADGVCEKVVDPRRVRPVEASKCGVHFSNFICGSYLVHAQEIPVCLGVFARGKLHMSSLSCLGPSRTNGHLPLVIEPAESP